MIASKITNYGYSPPNKARVPRSRPMAPSGPHLRERPIISAKSKLSTESSDSQSPRDAPVERCVHASQ